MEEQLNSLAVTHLLQHSLRSLCIHENSQWVYAVFWRILPRNYPPPKWDSQGGAYDRSRGNRRNWILVWEDGFCNFAASTAEMNGSECPGSSSNNNNYGEYQHYQAGLQPELFFKMSHEIYNYGEGIIGKVAADHSHKWIYKEPNEQEINFLSAWHNSADSHPRTWEAQFRSGIKTIALIAVREGVIQLGAVHKVIEDLSYVVLLRKKFSYIESIPGVLLPHPSSSAYPFKVDGYGASPDTWHFQTSLTAPAPAELYEHFNQHHQHMKITPSMSSLEALLSKLPSVVPAAADVAAAGMTGSIPTTYCHEYQQPLYRPNVEMLGLEKVAKEEYDDDDENNNEEKTMNNNNNNNSNEKLDHNGGESSSSMSSYSQHHHHYHQQNYGYHHHHHDLNVSSSMPNNGY